MTSALALYTLFHVVLSLAGICAGLVVAGGFVSGKRLDAWAATFLSTTVATNLTGFGFPFEKFLPSHAIAILSLAVLTVVVVGRYFKHLVGWWRAVFVGGSVLALYLNFFVLIAQLFTRLPALAAAAPTQKEAPFVATQLLVLALFVWLGAAAWRGYRGAGAAVSASARG